jgi:hypothetical protein
MGAEADGEGEGGVVGDTLVLPALPANKRGAGRRRATGSRLLDESSLTPSSGQGADSTSRRDVVEDVLDAGFDASTLLTLENSGSVMGSVRSLPVADSAMVLDHGGLDGDRSFIDGMGMASASSGLSGGFGGGLGGGGGGGGVGGAGAGGLFGGLQLEVVTGLPGQLLELDDAVDPFAMGASSYDSTFSLSPTAAAARALGMRPLGLRAAGLSTHVPSPLRTGSGAGGESTPSGVGVGVGVGLAPWRPTTGSSGSPLVGPGSRPPTSGSPSGGTGLLPMAAGSLGRPDSVGSLLGGGGSQGGTPTRRKLGKRKIAVAADPKWETRPELS